mgnify:FL=1
MRLYEILKSQIVNLVAKSIPESVIKSTALYVREARQSRELQEQYQRALGQYDTAIQTHCLRRYEDAIRIAGLKKRIGKTSTRLKSFQVEYQERVSQLKQESKEEVERVKSAYLANIRVLLEQRRQSRLELALEKAARERLVNETIEARLPPIIEERCGSILQQARARVDYLEIQSSYQIGNIGYKERTITRLKNVRVQNLLRILEASGEFSRTLGIYIDTDFNPLYATPAVYATFGVAEENLSSPKSHGILGYLDSESRHRVLAYIQGKLKKVPTIKVDIDGNERSFKFKPVNFVDEDNKVMGTFVQLRDVDQGVIAKLQKMREEGRLSKLLKQIIAGLNGDIKNTLSNPETT